ncbi:sensor histidine kinase [Streptomyces rapamycinicus]|uniref:histidine kinase n=1 Tax=Streptomyces rapamycinicus TaxID=1226757 RepID=A0ABR6LYE1_9ACTN|nr:HAMP domain-containing sensor histidine kinase [Streptomyces rapamycinicus]MBB4787194.1 signal transduction histidine kinase [Streptomyces rapamycinicus]UTO67155.1 HAMP domain-containing histidine kinase [Streptomyces rapamycinicus]UTP35112.1 HAMP domain-containing histidine kinase [Streptomyces rapamycinicus NRRL 5491]
MNATEPRRRWWPRSVRARTALAAASAAAVILVGIGWWVHHDVYRQSTQIAQGQAQEQLLALVDQLKEGAVPARRSTVPYEIVATGRRAAVAYGGGMEEFDPGTRHVLPAPPKAELPAPPDDGAAWGYTTRPIRIPARQDSKPGDRFGKDGGTYPVMYDDVRADELSGDKVAALGVGADARLRVYVVVLPHAGEDIAEAITKATDRLLLRAGLVSLVLIATVAYFAVRIALRPVEAIRVLTASVTANDPRERVTVPATGHEITALATTINTTLQRLDNAAAQQRRFVADAAHELRSPLTTLLASLEVALAYPERTDWPAAATTAARQTRRLQALAEDLLLLARLDTPTPTAGPETVDLTALASRLAEQYPLTERPLTLTCDSSTPAHAHGNPDEYERLLRNLIDNAARHAAHRIQITIRNEDAWVVLTVHDDGPGVPPEDAERIFERFVRLDDARSRDHGGTGLGLAIARDLAHRHRGTLTLTPRTLGACFQLRLPQAPAPAEK